MTNRQTPVLIPSPANVFFVAVSAGGLSTCALASTGAAYCWGGNSAGQVGDGTLVEPLGPTAVTMPTGVSFVQVETASGYACGLTSAGAMYCWGSNANGALGDGTTTNHSTPALVTMPAGVGFVQFATGAFNCAVSTTGVVYCWGRNPGGTLGDGTSIDHFTPQPIQMPTGILFASVAVDPTGTACAVATSGAIYCWGGNFSGQLGNGTTVNSLVPVRVAR